jgi:hypothetical protein
VENNTLTENPSLDPHHATNKPRNTPASRATLKAFP